ncbi:MAG TPA: ElyC/SanA/YdcF family protein, partial [Nannocystaceae bacterium]|nr:ElyC/SanA/YdcF family protein [Nannocystaceae bacterium]
GLMRRRRLPAVLGASMGVLGGVGLVWSWRLRQAAADRTWENITEIPHAPWVIVPGARVRDDGRPSNALADRLAGALALLDAGIVERVLVSGNNRTTPHGEVDVMVAWMKAAGVVAPVLARDDHGDRTVDTMRNASRAYGITRAIVCTQAFHLPRSLYLADAAGIDALGLTTDSGAYAHATRDALREQVASMRALVDVELLGRAG